MFTKRFNRDPPTDETLAPTAATASFNERGELLECNDSDDDDDDDVDYDHDDDELPGKSSL